VGTSFPKKIVLKQQAGAMTPILKPSRSGVVAACDTRPARIGVNRD
jgi:hypothetical protein